MWLASLVTLTTRNPVGEFLLTSTAAKIEDAADLVESVKAQSSDEAVWMTFCKLIDRVLLITFFVLYFFMIVSLLPEGYIKATYDPVESVS